MAAARKGRSGAHCPVYGTARLSDVARAGLAVALKASFSPPDIVPARMDELLIQLENVSSGLTSEGAGPHDTPTSERRR